MVTESNYLRHFADTEDFFQHSIPPMVIYACNLANKMSFLFLLKVDSTLFNHDLELELETQEKQTSCQNRWFVFEQTCVDCEGFA